MAGMSRLRRAAFVAGAVALTAVAAVPAAAQPGGPGAQQRQQVDLEELGFTRIFDGSTLNGWDGDPRFWRVENGAIVGVTTAETPLEENTFLIYRAGDPVGQLRDFELRLQFRIVGSGNSGVQVRSSVRPDASHRWRLSGYQVDMDFQNRYTGMTYGEMAGGFLAPRGTVSYIGPGQTAPTTIGTLGGDTDLRGLVNVNDWNDLHIIFRGNTLINILNGRVTSILIDDNPAGGDRLEEGWIGLQIHTGPPMRVEFRNIYLKEYES